jgi:NhaA family Na+:H+ antiporter
MLLFFVLVGLEQLGVFGTVVLARLLRIARLPDDVTWPQVYGVAILFGIGFTLSLSVGTLALEHGNFELPPGVKLGVLVGTLLSAGFGMLVLHLALPRKTA